MNATQRGDDLYLLQFKKLVEDRMLNGTMPASAYGVPDPSEVFDAEFTVVEPEEELIRQCKARFGDLWQEALSHYRFDVTKPTPDID